MFAVNLALLLPFTHFQFFFYSYAAVCNGFFLSEEAPSEVEGWAGSKCRTANVLRAAHPPVLPNQWPAASAVDPLQANCPAEHLFCKACVKPLVKKSRQCPTRCLVCANAWPSRTVFSSSSSLIPPDIADQVNVLYFCNKWSIWFLIVPLQSRLAFFWF